MSLLVFISHALAVLTSPWSVRGVRPTTVLEVGEWDKRELETVTPILPSKIDYPRISELVKNAVTKPKDPKAREYLKTMDKQYSNIYRYRTKKGSEGYAAWLDNKTTGCLFIFYVKGRPRVVEKYSKLGHLHCYTYEDHPRLGGKGRPSQSSGPVSNVKF